MAIKWKLTIIIGAVFLILVIGGLIYTNQEIVKDLFPGTKDSKSSFAKEDFYEERDNLSKNYTEEDKRIVIRNSTSNEVLIDIKLVTPLKNPVSVGNNVMFAKIKVDDFLNSSRGFFNYTTFIDLNTNTTINKNITFKYGIEYQIEVCSREDRRVCLNSTRINWTEFTSLRKLPRKNISIGLFTNTLYKERIEWIPNIYGFNITEWASYSTSDIYSATFDAAGTPVNNTFDSNSTGSNRLLVVCVTWDDAQGQEVTSVTYNSVTVASAGAPLDGVQIFTLVAPATGNNTLTVDPVGGLSDVAANIAAVVYTDVDQTTPIDNYSTNTGFDFGAPFNSLITFTSETGDLAFSCHNPDGDRTVDSDDYDLRESNSNTVGGSVSSLAMGDTAGASSVTMTTTWNAFLNFQVVAININNGVSDTSPQWSNNQTNSTVAGTSINHSVQWTDDSALANYTFSFDNGTGSFVNDSVTVFIGTTNFSNVIKIVNSTEGSIIRWRVYANDSTGNTNVTDIFNYTTTSADTCTYGGSGDWNIQASDDCIIISNVVGDGSDLYCIGSGTLTFEANISGFDRGIKDNNCQIRKLNSAIVEWDL